MTLQQLSTVKRWHLSHPRRGSVECQLWDVMLTCWVIGRMGLPVSLLLMPSAGILGCLALLAAPGAYVALRQRLHRRGKLRCDWLDSALPD